MANIDLEKGRKGKYLSQYALGLSAILGWCFALLLISTKSSDVIYKEQLTPEISYNYTRYTVWFHSEGKVRELRSILSQYDINDPKEIGKIKMLIKSMLIRRTEVYTQELNALNMPIPSMGQYYLTVFDFERFLQEVVEVSLSKEMSLDAKMISVYEIMFVYQTEANKRVKTALWNAG